MVRNGLVVLVLAWGAPCVQAQKSAEVVIDPAKADDDFRIQGEYLGTLGDSDKLGAEVIARGNGTFAVNFLPGGLRGAGGDYNKRIEATARTTDKTVNISTTDEKWTGTVADGKLTGKNADGKTFTLTRVVRSSKTMGEKPPPGAVVLYAAPADAANWTNAKVVDNHLVGNESNSKQNFKDHKIHLEFRLSYMPTKTGQARSNSGIYVQNKVEVQVLDSFGLKGASNECGAIYNRVGPLVNMCYPPLQWQTYDIEYRAPRLGPDGKKVAEATLTVWHNGILVHDKYEVKNIKGDSGPLRLQSHGGQVQYRNIWIVERDGAKEN